MKCTRGGEMLKSLPPPADLIVDAVDAVDAVFEYCCGRQ